MDQSELNKKDLNEVIEDLREYERMNAEIEFSNETLKERIILRESFYDVFGYWIEVFAGGGWKLHSEQPDW